MLGSLDRSDEMPFGVGLPGKRVDPGQSIGLGVEMTWNIGCCQGISNINLCFSLKSRFSIKPLIGEKHQFFTFIHQNCINFIIFVDFSRCLYGIELLA